MPRGVRAMCETVLDAHELTAEAIYRQDRQLLRRTLLTDPPTQSIEDTDALMSELFEAEREALPAHWFSWARLTMGEGRMTRMMNTRGRDKMKSRARGVF